LGEPFTVKKKVSLKAFNLNGQQLKVNDSVGNPIEIAAVIVWQIKDTAKAVFAVENYLQYVNIQSEAAVRHLANSFPYDHIEDESASITLRGGSEQVGILLEKELNERLDRAGIEVLEARISHLAYAPEIAHAMLQRQQASAIISARRLIVEGAVGMVEMALTKMEEKNIIELDEERKAAMVSNLLVVLCGDRSVSANCKHRHIISLNNMNVFRSFDQIKTNELFITRHKWFLEAYYELTDGQFVYGRLSYRSKSFKRYAIIETAQDTWTIKPKGWFKRSLLINKGEDETIGTLIPETWKRNVNLEMDNGFKGTYLYKKLFSRSLTFTHEHVW
jgi:hypothetical protein